ncbi:MAG: hypothetical protein ACXWC9_10050, partial [Pseudobdellovibrionaceae bacterium]
MDNFKNDHHLKSANASKFKKSGTVFLLKPDAVQSDDETSSPKLDWLSGGGEISDLIRKKDWSKTALGPIELWPQSLRTTVSLCLSSNFPINIIWGPDGTQIYNLGYQGLCGGAHPRAMGESY